MEKNTETSNVKIDIKLYHQQRKWCICRCCSSNDSSGSSDYTDSCWWEKHSGSYW